MNLRNATTTTATTTILVLAAALLALAGPASAADRACDILYTDFMLPEERGEARPTQHIGEPLAVEVGRSGKLFLFYRERSGTHHVLTARIEGPTSRSDQRLIRVRPQDAKDLEMGRVDIDTSAAGRVRLPYTITGARGGADVFAQIPERCRSGHLTLQLAPAASVKPPAPAPAPPPTVPAADLAARELATRLSTAILDTTPDQRLLDTYAATLRRDGRNGLIAVTADLLASSSFQRRLPENARKVRVVPSGGDRIDDDARRQLLFDLYDDLLGSGQVTLEQHQANSVDFASCLGSPAGSPVEACRQLASRLVGNPAFASRHGDLLTAIGMPWVQTATPGGGTPALADRYRVARDMVELLYGALLRREETSEVHEAYVNTVAKDGIAGLATVAGEVAASVEFRSEAPQRSRANHPELSRATSPQEAIRTTLLADIYGDLYRLAGLSFEERRQHDALLARCIERNELDSCRQLGRELVAHQLFRESHAEALGRLGAGGVGSGIKPR